MKKIENFLIKHLTRICVGIASLAIIFCIVIYFDFCNSQSWFSLNFDSSTSPQSSEFSVGEQKIKITEFLRNIFLGLLPLIGLPFVAWQNKNAFRVKEIAENNLQETQRNNRRTQENNMFVKCVEQLASDKETIRTASIHGFHELLNSAQREIKSAENEEIKNERIEFQDKILNILWSFMMEHSRNLFILDMDIDIKKEKREEIEKEFNTKIKESSNEANNKLEKFKVCGDELMDFEREKIFLRISISKQFYLIMEILAEFRNRYYDTNNSRKKFWVTKSWTDIYLQGIDLSHANLTNANCIGIDLSFTELIDTSFFQANLQNAIFSQADLKGTSLTNANLCGANLQKAKNIEYAKFKRTKYNSSLIEEKDTLFGNDVIINPTIFPKEIDTDNKNRWWLIDVSEQENQQDT